MGRKATSRERGSGRYWPCRCSDCRQRKTFGMKPENYVDQEKLRCLCGGVFLLDVYRKYAEGKKKLCECPGHKFPHRTGSVRVDPRHGVCEYNNDGSVRAPEDYPQPEPEPYADLGTPCMPSPTLSAC